jgi:hypothetical protein
MKRLSSSILLLLIIPIVVIGQNLKALDEKNGFREAKFGMSPSSFKKLEPVKMITLKGLGYLESKGTTSHSISFEREYYDKDVDLHIGDFPLDYVEYYFYKNILVSIEIKVSNGFTNQNGVLNVLETAYGKGVLQKYNLGRDLYYIWEGEEIAMSYTLISEYSDLIGREIAITSKKLKKWEEADKIIEAQREAQREEQTEKQKIQEAAKKL